MIKPVLLFILAVNCLGLVACQSSMPTNANAKPNPYALKTWARCRPITGPATEVDFYFWNRSSMALNIDLAALFANKSLAPLKEITTNVKSTTGIQYFRRWKKPEQGPTVPMESWLELLPNDAVDITFDASFETSAQKAPPFEVHVNFLDPQKISYQVVIPCRK